MKRNLTVIIVTLTLGLVPQVLLSQGTVYLSNLGESGVGSVVGGGSQSFETGVASNGYLLNSIELLMDDFAPNASNFSVSIYSDQGSQPGIFIGTLSGNFDPETAGQYIYTASGIILNSTTTYWIVASCDSSSEEPPLLPPGGYTWQITSSPNYVSENGWNIDTSLNSTLPGSYQVLQFSINATPVPEPSVFGLLVLGSLFFRLRRSN